MTKPHWLAVLLMTPAVALAQTISFTFDDGLDPRKEPNAATWNAKILEALATRHVEAMLFPAGRNVDSPDGLALVRAWSAAGHAIGNHTYSHRNLASTRVTLDEFTADIVREEKLVGDLPGWEKRLRFPFLKEGDTREKRDGLRAWMASNGYAAGAVSIDASDWYYDERFRAWRKAHPDADPSAYREAYLAHLWDRAQYYEKLSAKVTGRSPAHVLLLHTNAINAAFLPDVIDLFRAKGWKIVGARSAFADAIYTRTPDVLPAGESIVWAIAKEAGVSGLRYPAEDSVYEKPILDALGL